MNQNSGKIPQQYNLPWSIAGKVSWAGVKRRLLRGIITMSGVVLAIAFLTYMMVSFNVTDELIGVAKAGGENISAEQIAELEELLNKAGVNVHDNSGERAMMYLLISLSLFTCLVGILNSMIMAVTERVREIGTLKCLGATDRFIVKTYLIESSLQGIMGALLGVILGLLVAVVVSFLNFGGFALSNFPLLNSVVNMFFSLLIGAFISVLASIIPAYMAAKKEPVEALRVEE